MHLTYVRSSEFSSEPVASSGVLSFYTGIARVHPHKKGDMGSWPLSARRALNSCLTSHKSALTTKNITIAIYSVRP